MFSISFQVCFQKHRNNYLSFQGHFGYIQTINYYFQAGILSKMESAFVLFSSLHIFQNKNRKTIFEYQW